MRIGVDLMGADTEPSQLFEGVLTAAEKLRNNGSLLVYLTQQAYDSLKNRQSTVEYEIISDVITMEDPPAASIKTKPNSSLVRGLKALASKEIDAFVSCGNTGAVTSGAVLILDKLPGVLRPGLVATLPSKKGPVVVLDVGGSASSKPRYLIQFANLGLAYHTIMFETKRPSVGLLNIGEESKKGREDIKEVYDHLTNESNDSWQFVGNVEGHEIFSGNVDVIVTDGFTGNVLLKTAEGTASFVFDAIKNNCGKDVEHLRKQFCEDQQSGALLCGVDGVVIKIHGNATAKSIQQGILKASECVSMDLVRKIANFLR